MCGIAGIIHFNGEPIRRSELEAMSGEMAARGPDHEGIILDNNIGLAHRRLSIIDLSSAANQPMSIEDSRLSITYNGEIYNFKHVKKELQDAGVHFTTESDTEVLLRGYLHWGIEKLLSRVNGMYAFVLVDKKDRKAFACRDRFGEKPLYYLHTSSRIKFASSIACINHTETGLTLDAQSLDHYLSELAMPQPKTIWKEVKQVQPAHYLSIDLSSGSLNEKCYWDLNSIAIASRLDDDELLDITEQKLLQAINECTVSDVGFACFLSGGVDSGLVVSMLAAHSKQRVRTFTIGYKDQKQNEAPLARRLAEKYNTDHTELFLEPEVIHTIDTLIENIGEPFADPSLIPTYFVTKAIAGQVKVAISGDGGDEMFGGYFEYNHAWSADRFIERHPSRISQSANANAGKVLHRLGLRNDNPGHYYSYAHQHPALYLYRQKGFHPFRKKNIYSASYYNEEIAEFTPRFLSSQWEQHKKDTLLDTLFFSSVRTRFNEYLVKVDRASMANSLEVRTPFLNKDLAEFIFSVPGKQKVKNGVQKYLLKKLGQKYIDKDIFLRPKQGFGVPVAEWFRHDLKDYMRDILFSSQAKQRGIFNMAAIEKATQQHIAGLADNSYQLWLLLVLELWFRKFYDKRQ
jgi:asparagine synthase (glutamine-hydrolysing)